VTRPWQVSARSHGEPVDQKSLDRSSIRNRSLWLDIYLLMPPIVTVVRGSGAY
jgi:lipopolysaccharide/colanic/teichoic acid biosynthesis glycosyltransferase